MGQYHTQLRTVEDGHCREKRNLAKQLKEVKTHMRALKIANTKMRKNIEARKRAEEELQKELEAVKDANKKLVLKNNTEVITLEKTHQKEKKILLQRNLELRSTMRSLKVANSKLTKQLEPESTVNEEEKGILRARNQEIQQELEALKVANRKLMEQLGSERKVNEEEKGILRARNQEIQQELEALKARVPTNNLQLASSGSGPQGQTETSASTMQPKACIDNFHPIRILGEGAFGQVVLVKKKGADASDQPFAMKIMKKSHVVICCSASYTVAEKQALVLACGHPFITTLYSCFQTKEHLFFLMEYVSGGNMATELTKVQVFSEKRAQFYAAEITLALEFLHRCGILHRDLKLDNILIDGDGHCKVADFGLSKLGVFDGCKIEGVGGTIHYMAPETLQGLPCGQEVDWWALGVIMYCMIAGDFPFSDTDEYREEQKIQLDEVTYPMGISKEAKLIMRSLLTKDPKERLGAYGRSDNVREQPFFRGIDWRALREKRVKPPQKPEIVKEIEENVTFKDLLKPDSVTCKFNQQEFDGFTFINHGVPQ